MPQRSRASIDFAEILFLFGRLLHWRAVGLGKYRCMRQGAADFAAARAESRGRRSAILLPYFPALQLAASCHAAPMILRYSTRARTLPVRAAA